MSVKIKSKAQIGLEFVIYAGISAMAFFILSVAALDHINDAKREQELFTVEDFSTSIQYQLVLLASTKDGTSLIVDLPNRIANRFDYTIINGNFSITILSDQDEKILPTPRLQGNLTKGTNTVTNTGGRLVIS